MSYNSLYNHNNSLPTLLHNERSNAMAVFCFMKHVQRLTLSLLTLFAGLFLFALSSHAAGITSSCQPIYGGGQICVQAGDLQLNKTVRNPQSGAFVENLGVNDPKYGPDQDVSFQIMVTNTGNDKLTNITVKEIFPQHVTYLSGPGTVDNAKKVVTFTVDALNPNETKTFTFTGKIAPANNLPNDKNVVCVINRVSAKVGDKESTDNAQFCIQKGVAPQPGQPTQPGQVTKGGLPVMPPTQVTTTPSTGPEALALLALLPSGVLGYIFRKKSINK